MNAPKPPFRSVSEELLYNIYLKVTNNGTGSGITPNDIDTLAKLNSFLTDAVLMKADDIMSAINALKGNVPVVANSLEKLYNIVQGLTYLRREDIDHLAELNAIVQDADLVRTEDLTTAVNGIKGNVPVNGNTLEKLYNLIQGFSFLRREDIDTIGELNALVTDGDLVRVQDLADALVGLNLKKRTLQFFFSGDWDDDEHYNHYHDRDAFVLRGKINSLSHDFTHQLSGVSYKSRLDVSSSWTSHSTLTSLQSWINANATGDETTGTKYWIKCLPIYKQGYDDEAMNILTYNVQ
ncbi:MAG TPA: hypothetical protein PKL56_18385 [Cyclobacteriaceae bacterium]|nr:hypothetical protein [Cyclobacteriaceae bacterium]HMX00917.1 hypothetical protein [Cyclobacteriaceae bacterium]HMX50040.1 hypothetical protein [Cyclobacteriaceae bacterium]HMY93721.1 hypothetical protein [Cyclobacteriaceae bacterium]HNA12624.1 hypothetical protein [Cyclobacteriaceae bacterium]